MLHQFRREAHDAQEWAEAAVSLAQEQGFPFWLAMGMILRAGRWLQQGQARKAIAQITPEVAAYRATGANRTAPISSPCSLKHVERGQTEAGLDGAC